MDALTKAKSKAEAGEGKAPSLHVMDANEAAAYVAYKVSEVCAIYPITPSSPMGEWADEWSAKGKKNIFGQVPRIVEMESEAGAAGTVHGAILGGTLSSTFTASQGLLLMIPNMFKIAGELNPAVFHIAARSVAAHALSIFGDHSDVMAARSTGWAMLFSRNGQEAMDMGLVSHSVTLDSRIPFMNIFDGFRTSHELTETEIIPDEIIKEMINEDAIQDLRDRALSPNHPEIRGTAQNPDVYFQNREAANKYYDAVPEMVKKSLEKLGSLTGRHYKLFDYYGDPQADRVIIAMGSAAGAIEEMVDYLTQMGEKVGLINVRLFRPFSIKDFIEALPSTVKQVAVLDRCKEANAMGEPLYMDVLSALSEAEVENKPNVIGGRYGLSSKEFNPAMVKAIYDELKKAKPIRHFTVGIEDDVTHLSLPYDNTFSLDSQHLFRGLFYGLGADGTVSANKNSIKIIGNETDNYVQGYFVYDSKKSGSLTTSHLRFGKKPIKSTYLINSANFVACHQFQFLFKYDILKYAEPGATFLLNAPYTKEELWSKLPETVQKTIIEKKLNFYAINAYTVSRETGMGSRVNTILQTCFFAISNIIPKDEAIAKIKKATHDTYIKKGEAIVNKNFAAIDMALAHLYKVDYSKETPGTLPMDKPVPDNSPKFVKEVLGAMIAGNGDDLPTSALPADAIFPTGTTRYEKRNIAEMVPEWDAELCTQCGKCSVICPHACIRPKVYSKELLNDAPATFKSIKPVGKEWNKDEEVYTLQVSIEDCTGCSLCVHYCPMTSKADPKHKAINMVDKLPLEQEEKKNWEFFFNLPEVDRKKINATTVKASQFYQPLFEFSGACSGCGETPYLKLLTQLFGERMIVANATGCSSIYGGNLPTTPWAANKAGFGPAWANSLFEDNAEFGLGIKLATDKKAEIAKDLLGKMKDQVGSDLADKILTAPEVSEAEIEEKRNAIHLLQDKLKAIDTPEAKSLFHIADFLSKKSVWIIGGDGWAYDIGYGGLDHVISTGENVNILVLDTEVYSNTGGQKSKSTPIGASAKYSVNGKTTGKKDLALQAIAHGKAYVAHIALGANDAQTIRTMLEAEAYDGPSLIIAYSHCISHGFNLANGAEEQKIAVQTGYWPLFHYNPDKEQGKRFVIDSKAPERPLSDFMYNENRFKVIKAKNADRAETFMKEAEGMLSDMWNRLNTLKGL